MLSSIPYTHTHTLKKEAGFPRALSRVIPDSSQIRSEASSFQRDSDPQSAGNSLSSLEVGAAKLLPCLPTSNLPSLQEVNAYPGTLELLPLSELVNKNIRLHKLMVLPGSHQTTATSNNLESTKP